MNEIVQGSTEWHLLRVGKVTASCVSKVIAKARSEGSGVRATYMAQLIAERLTGTATDSFTSAEMQWGTDQEPDARLTYEFLKNAEVEQVAFVHHPEITMSGASPDGLVGEYGLIEIKCPNTSTHIDTLLSGKAPSKYIKQMQWQMACTGRKWCDFVSYDPRMPEELRLFVKRVERDNALIAELESEVSKFLNEIDEKIAALTAIYSPELKDAA